MGQKLITFDDTDVMYSARDSYFDTDFVFQNDLWYAFAITAYDSNQESIEDPTIGTLEAYYKSWGLVGDGGVHFEKVPTRNCTEAELHVND